MSMKLFTAVALLAGAIQLAGAADWVNISDPLVAAVTNGGTPIPWPGNTAGVWPDTCPARKFPGAACGGP